MLPSLVTSFETRVGAYGVIVVDGRILLTHFNVLGESHWTLPGGGLEQGEDAETAALREIREETGYQVVLEGLLTVHSAQIPAQKRLDRRPLHLHLLRLIYLARIVGGELTVEVGGSTDDVMWTPLDEVAGLSRVDLVDVALRHWPGHVDPPGAVSP